jgi:hypothetical protein
MRSNGRGRVATVNMADFNIQGMKWPGQFCLCRDSLSVLSDWPCESLAGWNLWHCPTLPVSILSDSEGGHIGWLLGYPISPDGILISERCAIGAKGSEAGFAHAVDGFIGELAGRFAAILVAPTCSRVYVDPAGQRPVVFNSSERRVASSLGLATSHPDWDVDLMDSVDVERCDRWYPFGLTPDRNVRRLLPNHGLDLNDFTTRRIWPGLQDVEFGGARDPREWVARIADKARSNIAAVSLRYPIQMSLTGGRDSRMLLAVSKPYLSNIEYFTIGLPDASGMRDGRVASELARRFGLRHRILEWRESSAAVLDDWQKRTGFGVAGRTGKSAATLSQLDSSRVVMYGLCIEVGRSERWRASDFSGAALAAEELLVRFKIPVQERLLSEATKWLKELPVSNRLDILDLAHIEQRLGCWAGPSYDGYPGRIVMPFSDRGIFRLMLELPRRYRFEQRLALDLIRNRWPALLGVPFNREPGLKSRIAQYMSQLARENPGAAQLARKVIRPFR